jgi:hypothetical protein
MTDGMACSQREWKAIWRQFAVVLAFLLILVPQPGFAERPELPGPHAASAGISATAAELGLIDTLSYASPQFGIEVSWTDAWQADPAAMESDPARALDRLSIVSESSRFQVFLVSADGEPVESYLERFVEFRTADDSSARVVSATTTGDHAVFAYHYIELGEDVYDLVEIRLVSNGSVIQVVEVIAWADEFDAAFDQVDGEIEVGREAPFLSATGWPAESAVCLQERQSEC